MEVGLDVLLMMLVAYLLVGLGVAIGRWDFESGTEGDAAWMGVLLTFAIALVWPWMIWRDAREASYMRDRYD